jgi:hypothetical protein
MPAGALDLESPDLALRLLGQGAGTCDGWKLVVPGNPNASLLVRKLEGNVPPDCGDPMPIGTPLAAHLVACVRDWIASLATDAAVVIDPDQCETCGEMTCVSLTTDAMHCGSCDNDCAAVGATCVNGQCQCSSGSQLCDGRCVDPTRDADHCGACGKACGSGASCSDSICGCGEALASCSAGCAELATDPSNCGSCDIVCGPGKLCTPSGCGTQAACTGLTKCGSACVDTKTSWSHCGGCNMPCGAEEICVNGACSCPNGTDKLCAESCLDVSSDNANCGACGKVCRDGTSCNGGACTCSGGGADCAGNCVDLQQDLKNCGACGHACAPGQTCQAGQCSCSDRSVSFATDVAPILAQHCTNAGCHSGSRAKAALDLTLAKSYSELVNVSASQCGDGRLLVDPQDASRSYLVQKLLGTEMCQGGQMPKAGVSLPSAQLEAITAWICQGASP